MFPFSIFKNITNVGLVERIYNTLYIERNMGLELPDWTHDIFPDKLLPLAARNLELLTETPYMMKVKGGIAMKFILYRTFVESL